MIVEAIESAVRYASSAHYVPRRPSANRGWRIFSRLEEGRSHRQMWALHVTTGEEILLFNLNDYVKQGGYAQVGAIALSNDARFVVFALDDTGAEDFTLRCRDLRSNKDIIEPVSAACRGAAIDSVSGAFSIPLWSDLLMSFMLEGFLTPRDSTRSIGIPTRPTVFLLVL